MVLTSFSVRRPITVLMLTIGVAGGGLFSLQRLEVNFLPDVRVPRFYVRTLLPGAPPVDVERRVTEPLEDALEGIRGIRGISAVSWEGVSLLTVIAGWKEDRDLILLEVRDRLDRVRALLPSAARRPTLITEDPQTEPVMTIGLPPMPGKGGLVEMMELAEGFIKPRLEQLDGVAQVTVAGGVRQGVNVRIDEHRLRAFGVHRKDIVNLLAAHDLPQAGGIVEDGRARYSLRLGSTVRTLADLESMILSVLPGGRPLRLADVAEVSITGIQEDGRTLLDGTPVVVLLIRKDAEANTLEVSSCVRAELAQLANEQQDLAPDILDDHAEYIRASVQDLESAAVTGGLLAFVVLLVFLRNASAPLIIGVALPVSLLGAFLVMEIAGMSLNIVSLTGLALGIGMLGDNSTIVMENVARLREAGVPGPKAVLVGATGIGSAVTASTFTNVAVFLPLLLIEGVSAHLFRDMAITMTVSLLISLLVASTLVPVLLMAQTTRKSSGNLSPVLRLLARLAYRYEAYSTRAILRLARSALDHPWKTLSGTGIILVTTAGIALVIPATPVPDLDQRHFSVAILFPGGISPGSRDSLISAGERLVRGTNGVARVLAGMGVRGSGEGVTVIEGSVDRVGMDVRVSEHRSTDAVMEEVRQILGTFVQGCEGAEMEVHRKETTLNRLLRVRGDDILVRVHGEDRDAALLSTTGLIRRLREIEGVADIRTTLRSRVPEYRVHVAAEKAAALGVPPADFMHEILAGQDSADVGDVSLGGKRTLLRLVPRWAGGVTLDGILASRVDLASGTCRAGDLMEYNITTGLRELHRANRERYLPIMLHVRDRTIAAVESEICDTLRGVVLPTGCTVSIAGVGEEQAEANRGLVVALLLAVLLVYMILASEYESFFSPLVILLTSPLAATGAIVAMALCGVGYNVMSLAGLALMVGAVDNDAVIVLDAILHLRRAGQPLRDAIVEGLRQRLRPIVMTSVTTVAGVAPLLVDFGAGSELVRSLTIPLAGGMVASAVCTVFVIPVVTLLAGRRFLLR